MSLKPPRPRVHERWAHFSVIGQLLAAPPPKGELKAALRALAGRTWQHPTTGAPVRFGLSTIERWYYRAARERADPLGVLRRKVRVNAGQQHAVSDAVRPAVLAQYAAHKSWSVQLHYDNLVALAETRPDLRPLPSYPTLRRFMKANGLDKRRRLTPRRSDGAERAEARLADREIRSYEAEYVNGLWHWDCHHGSRKVLTQRGEWVTPILFGVLDDRSRLACHLQWYLAETAEVIAHGLSQAFQKRGLPRSALSDNGAAMTAAEIGQGLARLGVLHQTTLPYSPYQYVAQPNMWRRLREVACGAQKPTTYATYSSVIDRSPPSTAEDRSCTTNCSRSLLFSLAIGPDLTQRLASAFCSKRERKDIPAQRWSAWPGCCSSWQRLIIARAEASVSHNWRD
jgi:putative transposase